MKIILAENKLIYSLTKYNTNINSKNWERNNYFLGSLALSAATTNDELFLVPDAGITLWLYTIGGRGGYNCGWCIIGSGRGLGPHNCARGGGAK